MFAINLPTTISEGYDLNGLTHNKDNKISRLMNTKILIKEAYERKIINIHFILYIPLRIIAIILR